MALLDRRRLLAAGAAAGALAGRGAAAQEAAWPARPLRIVVPFAPGGIVDVLARLLADRMGRGLGQPLVVETRPGAGGIGTVWTSSTTLPRGQEPTGAAPPAKPWSALTIICPEAGSTTCTKNSQPVGRARRASK